MDEGLSCPATNKFAPDDPVWNDPALANIVAMKGEGAQTLIATNLAYYSDYRDVQTMKSLSNRQFDFSYTMCMSTDHTAAVREFELASQTLTDPQLKKFATKTLPTLRKHQGMADHLTVNIPVPGDANSHTNGVVQFYSTPR
jgi:hypothetical protein